MFTPRSRYSVERQHTVQRYWRVVGVAALAGSVLAAGGLIAIGGTAKVPFLILLLAALVIGAGTIWRYPETAAYTMAFAVLFIDQWPIPGIEPFTTRLGFFQNLSAFTPIPIPMMPADALMYFALGAVALPALAGRGRGLKGGALCGPVLCFLAAVAWAFGYGYVAGPKGTTWFMNAAWAASRAFVQLVVAYFLVCNVIANRRGVVTLIWVITVALGLKGLQGINSYYKEYRLGLHLEALTGHEDVVFFAAFFILLGGMRLFAPDGGRQQRLMMAFLLPVAITTLATGRRSAFFVLGLGLIVLGICLYQAKPALFKRLAPPTFALLVVYTAVFWNFDNNPLGQPVRAFKSQFSETSERDMRSDLWRDFENLNVALNIRSAPLTGLGFGRPYSFFIEYPSLDSTGFIYWIYMTHNAIFWLWMKMGVFGFIAFWYLTGSAVVQGLLIFRTLRDPYLKVVGLFAACNILMQIFFSYGDLGLTYSRSMIFVGISIGLLAVLPDIARQPAPAPPAARPRARWVYPRRRARMEHPAPVWRPGYREQVGTV